MKRVGIGYENYKEFIDQDLYYVDKTLLVRDVLEKGGKVTLLTRPRRFGKTLGLSMLRTFFELEPGPDGNAFDNSRYFEGKKVMGCGEEVLSKMGKYPVISLSLKGAKQPDFAGAFFALRGEIIREYSRHEYLLSSKSLSEAEKDAFCGTLRGEVEWFRWEKELKGRDYDEAIRREVRKYQMALKVLSGLLKKHHGTNVMILLDEYDVPLENAWNCGFYQEMLDFIRSFFEAALKTNESLERAVITGCLRISRESIFTGMNNLEVISIRSSDFMEAFGFTQEETEGILCYYNLENKVAEVEEWYDGYLFGNKEIYNPWSVTKYVKAHLSDPGCFPEPYWSNTSSNAIVRKLILRADERIREELDVLVQGGTIEKHIHEDITYADVYESEENIWNFLFFTGYMKKVSERMEGDDICVTMCIPNREVRGIFRNQMQEWFKQLVKGTDRLELYTAVHDKDAEKIGRILTDMLRRSISTFDSAESFYHGFLLSMLIGMKDYVAQSNCEEGDGRPDIVLYPENPWDPAYIFEVKIRKKFNEMKDGLSEAFKQIETCRYEEGILDDGYAGVVSFGICFCRKSCIAGLKNRK